MSAADRMDVEKEPRASEPQTKDVGQGPTAPTSRILDLSALRLPQDFASTLGVKKVLVEVPVTNPRKEWFVRSRPGAEWRMSVAMLVLKEEGESYVVHPNLAADLPDDVTHYDLVTGINRQGRVFLWRLRHPNTSRRDSWADSAIAACELAQKHWVKVRANMAADAYEVAVATGRLPEPEWPEESFQQLFDLAFHDRVITKVDHPVIQRLKGAI